MISAMDRSYMIDALRVAQVSPDPSTQNGAVLVDPLVGLIIGSAANKFPDGVKYTDERWERPAKYQFIEHAERGAIFNAALRGERTEGSHLYCPWFACADCARAIICAGVSKVIGLRFPGLDEDGFPNEEVQARWGDSCSAGMTMLMEAGVTSEYITYEELSMGVPLRLEIRRGGEMITL